MAIKLIQYPHRTGNVPLRFATGHFATSHSHINYYIDITYQKTRLSEAKDIAKQLVTRFHASTLIDTILCLDGTEVIGTCLANELTNLVPGTMLKTHKNFQLFVDANSYAEADKIVTLKGETVVEDYR